jgi:tungstate transport system ATP-binding protein
MDAQTYLLSGVKKFYNDRPAVDIESLSIRESSITGLVGPNGSGKSTLLNMLAFIDSPSEGTILFKGEKAEPFSDAARFRVSLLPQEPYLLKRSVFDNISFGLKLRKVNSTRFSEQVDEALCLVGLSPAEFSNRPWYQLSGGEAQRVALAARLVLRPEVLILDEPTANVDADSAGRIMECALKASREWGTTLIISSHDFKWLHGICGSILQMFKGKVVGNGMENILFGPWIPGKSGAYHEKILADGQRVKVPKPPSPDSAAVIPQEVILFDFHQPAPRPDAHFLKGVISQLSLEPSAQTVLISIRAGDQTFAIRIPAGKAREKDLFPGQFLYITYPLSSVTWY